MSTLVTLIYFVIILGIIVLVHEFGHFIFAKMTGVFVYEFSIGMGPKIFGTKHKKGKTDYSIRAIPIGGYVQLAGEEIDDDKEVPKDQKMYNKPIWQRFLIMFFGAGNNFILAIILLFAYGMIWGSPNMKTIVTVQDNYPAQIAGMETGDKITKINNHKVSTIDDLALYLAIENNASSDSKNKELKIEVLKSDGSKKTYGVTPKEEVDENNNKSYVIGIELSTEKKHGFVEAIKYTFVKMGSLFRQMFITFGALFSGKIGLNNLAGPVGIFSIVGETRQTGLENLIQLVCLLCVNVGFINLIPLPAFDGGRILFLLIEKIKGSPVNPKVENTIHSIGFVLLLILLVFITFNDILRLF